MKRYLLLLGTLFLLTASFCHLQAEGYKVEDIPMVHLQNRTRYVSNPDGVLSEAVVAVMDTTLFALEQKTGIQTLVVAVRQIEGKDCFDFAYQLGEKTESAKKVKTTDWSSCWLPKNDASSLPPDTVWKASCQMPSANVSKPAT